MAIPLSLSASHAFFFLRFFVLFEKPIHRYADYYIHDLATLEAASDSFILPLTLHQSGKYYVSVEWRRIAKNAAIFRGFDNTCTFFPRAEASFFEIQIHKSSIVTKGAC